MYIVIIFCIEKIQMYSYEREVLTNIFVTPTLILTLTLISSKLYSILLFSGLQRNCILSNSHLVLLQAFSFVFFTARSAIPILLLVPTKTSTISYSFCKPRINKELNIAMEIRFQTA
jgi:hypothetical protein